MVQYTQYTKGVNDKFLRQPMSIGWPWRMFVFVLIVFAMSVLSYVGLTFGYKTYLETSIKNTESELASLALQIESKNQKNFIDFYSQVTNLKILLKSHIGTSKFLPRLEAVTHPQVTYSTVNLGIAERTLTVDGVAASYDVLSAQLAFYEQADWVSKVVLSSSSSSGQVVRFNVKLTIKDEAINL